MGGILSWRASCLEALNQHRQNRNHENNMAAHSGTVKCGVGFDWISHNKSVNARSSIARNVYLQMQCTIPTAPLHVAISSPAQCLLALGMTMLQALIRMVKAQLRLSVMQVTHPG